MKKTYIPSTPRSRKLKSIGGGTINVSGGSAQNVPAIEGHTHDNKIILDAITQLHLRILSSLNVDENGALIVELSNIIKELDTTVPTDENLFSALRTVLEIRARSISKTDPDTAQEIIKFVKGIEIGDFTTGPLGAGASLKMENGVSRMEVDQLDVRMRATFRELIIESLKHIGGQLILSPARMKCTSVVDGGTYYKCYFDTGDGKVSNEFVAGDQARCQVFTGSGVKMYWRLVTSVGTDWINISKTDAISGSSIPEAGDDIVQLGNRTDTTRQNAQILSTVGADAPSWKQYKGINSFSLEGKDTTVFSGTGNKIDGKTVFMSSGANVEDGINSKNSNYSLQPTSYKANDTWTLSADTTVNGIAYKSGEILTATQDSTTFVQAHWVKKVRYTDDSAVNSLVYAQRNLAQRKDILGWKQYANLNLTEGTDANGAYCRYQFGALTNQNIFPSISFKANTQYSLSVRSMIESGTNPFITIKYTDGTSDLYVLQYGSSTATTKTYITTVGKTVSQISHTYVTDGYIKLYWINVVEGTKPVLERNDAPEDEQVRIDEAVVKATYWSVKASAPVIYKDAINAATAGSHTSVTVSGELRSGTTTTSGGFITVTPNGGTEAGTASASPVTITPANGDGKTSYTVRLYDTASKTTLLDTMTIPVVFKGASGVNAINVVLSNEADVLPASTDGTVSDYSGSGTIIRVFEGATELDYDGMGTANGKFNVTASATGITAGAKSESGLTCVFANASNMTADNATIVFTITGKTADGTSFSITKTQSFAKSRTGQKGDAGVSITGVDVEFAKNTSPTTAPTTGWTTTAPAITGTEQLWTRTKTSYSTGNPTYSTPANITPRKGDTGTSISAVVEEYYLSTSNTSQTGGSWSETPPTWVQGKYIWSRVKITYTNPSSTATTTPYLSPEWDAINNTKLTAEQAQLAADGYMRARYIRDWCGRNTTNDWGIWSEVKVFLKNGTNIAQGKSVTGRRPQHATNVYSRVTDNNIEYYGHANSIVPDGETDWVRIDLGQVYYDIDYIQIWHYYPDGRTFYGTKTEISTDDVNWTPVFDSAKSGTYKETAAGNIISFRPNEVLAKVLKGAAVTDTFKTAINGGLISTVMILLRELNSIIETAGISGIQGALKNYPSMWSGGTYSQALALIQFLSKMSAGTAPSSGEYSSLAKITLLHNGAAKIGDFIIEPTGRIVMVDPATGVPRLIFGVENIPTIASLIAGTVYSGSTAVGGGTTSSVLTLSGSTNVTKYGATVTFNGTTISISASGRAQVNGLSSFAVAELYAYCNGVKTLMLASATVFFTNTVNYQNNLETVIVPVTNSYLTDAGLYTFKLEVITDGDISTATAECTASSFAWSYTLQGVRRQQYGLDGMMFFYSDQHLHYTEGNGLDLRGPTNMPGVLASGTINTDGSRVANTSWGAKNSTANATGASGTYTVPLINMSHANYQVQITPYAASRLWYVSAKTTSSFTVVITNTSGTATATKFDYTVIGNNY